MKKRMFALLLTAGLLTGCGINTVPDVTEPTKHPAANVPAEECLFIGDSLRKDYQGALNAGMQALWYCPDPAAAQAHPQIRKICNFDELRQMFL